MSGSPAQPEREGETEKRTAGGIPADDYSRKGHRSLRVAVCPQKRARTEKLFRRRNNSLDGDGRRHALFSRPQQGGRSRDAQVIWSSFRAAVVLRQQG